MGLTEDKVNTGNKTGKTSLFIALLLFAAILAAAFIVYLQSRDVDLSIGGLKKAVGIFSQTNKPSVETGEENTALDLPDEGLVAACTYKDMVVKYTGDGVQFLDKAGNNIKNLDITFNVPLFKSNGSDLIVADIGGKYLCIIHGTDIKWDKKTDGAIINADIAKNGYVTVIEEAKGYRNKVSLYDSLGIEKFYRNIANNRVISAEVSPRGEQLALLTLDTSGVFVSPGLEFLDLDGKSLAAVTPGTDQIFSLLYWYEDNSLITASDNTLVFYNKERKEAWNKKFEKIASVTGNPGRTTVVAYSTESQNQNVMNIGFYNQKGQQRTNCVLQEDIACLRSYSGTVAAFGGRKAFFLNSSGKVIGEYNAKTDIKDIYFFNKIEAVIVTRSSIVIIKI